MARAGGKDRGLFEHPVGSGIWWIRYTDARGKVRREKVGSKSAARALYAKRKAAVLEGRKIPELTRKELTLGELIDRYAPEFALKKSAAWDLRHSQRWRSELGDQPANQIKPGDIERVKAKWLGSFAPATCNRRIAYLKTLFGRGLRDGVVDQNPVAGGRVRMLREAPPRDRILAVSEESDLRETLSQATYRAMVVSLHTGLRISELLGCKRQDVDLERGIVTVRDTKAGGRAKIRLNASALAAIEQQIESHESKWVWPDSTGDGALSRHVLNRRFARGCARVKIEGMTWHGLRHTFVSRLVMMGENLVTVQQLARHKSLTITLRYAHLAPDHTALSLDRLAAHHPSILDPTATKIATEISENPRDLIGKAS